jgi:CBS domain-containing protein
MSTTERPSEGEPLARDIMTTPVVTVAPHASLKDLVALFRANKVGGVPVVDHREHLIGIVTEGDLMAIDADVEMPHWFELFDSIIYLGSQKKFKDQLEKAAAATVRDLMTEKVRTVRDDEPARKAARLMSQYGFDRVPVLDADGKVVGIITRHDIIKLLEL